VRAGATLHPTRDTAPGPTGVSTRRTQHWKARHVRGHLSPKPGAVGSARASRATGRSLSTRRTSCCSIGSRYRRLCRGICSSSVCPGLTSRTR